MKHWIQCSVPQNKKKKRKIFVVFSKGLDTGKQYLDAYFLTGEMAQGRV
jgi:hypothetical protein